MDGIAENGWKYNDLAENCWNGSEWLKMAEKGWNG